jgi:hypothetical protein
VNLRGGEECLVMEVDAAGMVENGGSGHEDGQGGAQHHHNPHHQHYQHQLAGPRPAPAYKAITAICERKDDGPGPRCGHTLTAVAAVGEEGTPGYVGPRLILFGGATALEGNSGQAGPQAAAAGAGIRMFHFHCVCLAARRLAPLCHELCSGPGCVGVENG